MKKSPLTGYQQYDTSKGFGSRRKWQEAFYERMTGEEAATIIREQRETPEMILGVSSNASLAEIKAAFHKLIKQWHPDKNPGNLAEAEVMSKKIIAAYTVLSNKH